MHTTSGKTSTGDWKGVFDAGFSVMKRMDFRHGASPMKIDEDCRKSLRFIADLPEYGHSPLPCSSTRESLIHLCLRSMISIWSSNYPLCQIRSPKKLELGCFWIHIPHVQHLCVLYVLDIYVIHCNIYIYIYTHMSTIYIILYYIIYIHIHSTHCIHPQVASQSLRPRRCRFRPAKHSTNHAALQQLRLRQWAMGNGVRANSEG